MACAGTCCNWTAGVMVLDGWLRLRDRRNDGRFACRGREAVCCGTRDLDDAIATGTLVAEDQRYFLDVESLCSARKGL